MPLYSDLGYYVSNSKPYSPYSYSSSPSTSYSPYSRAISGTYTAPPPRSSYTTNIGRHYKPILKPISESPYQTALRTNAMTALTRMNSGKYSNFFKPSSVYIPPRPIQINTADIDVSATKFNKNRNVRARSTSPEPSKTETATNDDEKSVSAYMPRVDQNDPPNFRSTIKRDRNIVRLSTMRTRKSRSKSNSVEKRDSSRKSTSSKKSSSDDQQDVDEMNKCAGQNTATKSWRDKFGDSLHSNTQKVLRKTPGELILEKHIIRDRNNEENHKKKTPSAPAQTIVRLPEMITPQEITYLEPIIRKSIRRQSLIKCPSFKDICKDISSDIKTDDDLNAGELRRRASLILEQEEQILAQITVSRRPSADLVNVDVPIMEEDEPEENKNETNETKESDGQAENIIIIKKRTKKKGGKVKHKITVTVDIDNSVVPILAVDPNCETSVSTEKSSPKWKAVVEEVEEEHTLHKVFKLPKKRTELSNQSEKLKKSESGEDFWRLIDRRESAFYKKKIDLKRNEMEITEIVNRNAEEQQSENVETPSMSASIVEEVNINQDIGCLATKSLEQNKTEEKETSEIPADVNRERRPSAVKSRSANDLPNFKEKKMQKTTKSKQKDEKSSATNDKKTVKVKKVTKSHSSEKETSEATKQNAEETVSKPLKTKTKSKSKSKENSIKSNASSKSSNDDNTVALIDQKQQISDLKIESGLHAKELESKLKSIEVSDPSTAAKKVESEMAFIQPNESKTKEKPYTNASALTKSETDKKSTITIDEIKKKKSKSSVNSAESLITYYKADANNLQNKSTNEYASAAHIENENDNCKIGTNADKKAPEIIAKSSITIEAEQHNVFDKDAKSKSTVDTNNNKTDVSVCETTVGLSKFPTVANLNSDLSSVHRVDQSNKQFGVDDEDCISGEETFDLLWNSDHDNDFDNSDQYTDTESEDEMGLKRRYKRKKDKFDPKRVVKLDHKRKCYVIDEAPKYPLIATPRPLQKKYHYFSESETESDQSDSECVSSDECYDDCLSPNDVVVKDVIRMSTSSNDSGFEGGGTAPSSPKKMLDCDVNCHKKCEKLTANLCGVNQKLIVEALSSVRRGFQEARDSPSTPPSHNPVFKIDSNQDSEDLETSYTFAQFQRSGTITAPATTIPRFKKYSVDDFHFLTVLGKGSFGKVLLAELRNTDYYYAVKCLKKDVVLEDDDVECTLIERKVLALGTKHPYLCHLFCTFQTESHLFFVMEYLNGGDLMFHIQVSGRFPEPRAKFYAAEIVSGLRFLHKKGIIYRDLKLDNILLDFDGHVRIADFGMCKLQIYLDRTTDSFCGTPDYMSPEVIKGQKYNQTVDWWSFGVLLYEMLIGQSPFSGCDEDELFWSICNEVPWYPFYLSKDALNILSKLLEKDSTIRLGSPSSPHGDITENVFFYEIEWKKLERRQLEPPFKPKVKHPLDTQYFDRAFTRERVRLTPIDKEILQSMDQHQFQGFTYTNPNATPA